MFLLNLYNVDDCVHRLSRGVLPLPTDGGAPLRLENGPYMGLIRFFKNFAEFAKKVTLNGTEIPKFSTFSPNFSKKAPYEGLIFLF